MSDYHTKRLRGVRAEMDAMNQTADYVLKHWDKNAIGEEIKSKPEAIRQAQINIEMTYFIRLYAEFEGLLKDHLATNHSEVSLPRKPKVDDVIASVIKTEGVSIEAPLRIRLNAIRDYRNSVAHSASVSAPPVLFADALSALNAFVARLSNPLL